MTQREKPLISRVAVEQIVNLEERFEGYREQVIKRLLKIIQSQEASAPAARRNAVERELTTLADMVVAHRAENSK